LPHYLNPLWMPTICSTYCLPNARNTFFLYALVALLAPACYGQYHESGVGKVSMHYIDSTSVPGVHLVLEGANALENGKLLIGPSTRIALKVVGNDPNPTIEYQVDDTPPSRYQNPFVIGKAGAHQVFIFRRHEEDDSISRAIALTVDSGSPVITASLVYKSVTLKRFLALETWAQNGKLPIECPVGTELHVVVKDDVNLTTSAFLIEGKAVLKIENGGIELPARGKHRYRILASDFLGNITQSPEIFVEIIER
jgi:hypothetical protein